MLLTQRQIEIFNAIMVHKSVTAAATSLRTSQPTVSRELRDLERRIGFELFSRFGKRLTPTDQAQVLYAAVARSFVGIEEISRVAAAIKGHNASLIRVGCLPAYHEALLPEAVYRFRKLRPQVHLSIHALGEVDLRHEITTQLFDVGLTESSNDYGEGVNERIDAGELVCVLPESHELAAKSVITPQDFSEATFVYFSEEDPYRRQVDDIFEDAGIARRNAIETTSATGLCSMIAAGVGISLINPFTAIHYIKRGVVIRRFKIAIPYYVNLWRSGSAHRASYVDEFTNILRGVTRSTIDKLSCILR